MNNKINHLANLLSLEAGESLPSFFIRLSNRQYDPAPEWLINFCQKQLSHKDVITCPTQVQTYAFLAQLTQVNCDDLYEATLHRFAEFVSPPANPPDTLVLPSAKKVILAKPSMLSDHIWAENAAQFCPRCLQEGGYHRLTWMLQAISACLKHQCLLVQSCPGCNARVRIQDVVNRYCDGCAFDLSRSPTISIALDDFGLLSQQIIQSWFGNVAVRDDTLPDHSPSTLYQITFGLHRAIRAIRQQWDYLHNPFNAGTAVPIFPCQTRSQLTSLKSYLLYATALKGLLNWPNGFYEFLTAYRLRDRRVPTDVVREDLGYIYSFRTHPDWQHPAFEFVRKALGTYLQEGYQYNFALKEIYRRNPHRKSPIPLEYISETAAAKLLQLPPMIVKRLVQLDYLAGYQPPKNNPNLRRFNLVKHRDVLELQKTWRGVIPLVDVARLLGVSDDTTLDLAMAGLLQAVRNFYTDDYDQVKIKSQSLTAFIKRLQQGSVHVQYSQQAETINLIEATRRVSFEGDKMVSLLERILAGELRAFWPPDINDLAHLEVFSEDLKKFS